MQEYRMAGVGRQVLDSRSVSPLQPRAAVYPFWRPTEWQGEYSPQPQKRSFEEDAPKRRTALHTSEVYRDLKSLEAAVDQQNRTHRNRRLMNQMNSFVSLLNSSPPKPPPTTDSEQHIEQVLGFMQHQQDRVFDLVKSIREPQLRIVAEKGTFLDTKESVGMEKTAGPRLPPIEEQYARVKGNPEEFKRLLAEVNFVDDGSENRLEGGVVFNPGLSKEEKARILMKIRENRKAREQDLQRKGLHGRSLFRALGAAVLFPIFAFSEAWKRKKRNKAAGLKMMTDTIPIYLEGAKLWVMKAVRAPLYSIINDEDLDLNVVNKGNLEAGTRGASLALKLQVRVRGILQGFRDYTNSRDLPGPLRLFVEKLVSNGSFVPKSYMLDFESARVSRDILFALKEQNLERKQMLISFFFITRVLIQRILLKLEDNTKISDSASKAHLYGLYRNLKIVASVLQNVVLWTFARTGLSPQDGIQCETEIKTRRKGEPLSQRNGDATSDRLFAFQELAALVQAAPGWIEAMREMILAWSEDVAKLCRNAELRNRLQK